MTELDKLKRHLEANNARIGGITLAEGFNGTTEDVAREINRVNAYLANPRFNAAARLRGLAMLKSDTVMCTENRRRLDMDTGEWVVCPPSGQEVGMLKTLKAEIRVLKEAAVLLEESI